jgi:hypothetical protein
MHLVWFNGMMFNLKEIFFSIQGREEMFINAALTTLDVYSEQMHYAS